MKQSNPGSSQPSFQMIIDQIEQDILKVYHLTGHPSVKDFLITANPGPNTRGSLIIDYTSTEEVSLGVFFAEDIIQRVLTDDPIQKLSTSNLDPYCVLIEEISHFHFIVHRLLRNKEISQLELEGQAEIDKVLICAIRLRQQIGDPHYLHLARMIFEHAHFRNQQVHYQEATKYAARFWYDLLTYTDGLYDPLNATKLHTILRKHYTATLEEKFRLQFGLVA